MKSCFLSSPVLSGAVQIATVNIQFSIAGPAWWIAAIIIAGQAQNMESSNAVPMQNQAWTNAAQT